MNHCDHDEYPSSYYLLLSHAFSVCSTSLGVEDGTIPDNQITASSTFISTENAHHFPSRARLNSIPDGPFYVGGWRAEFNNLNQWIQVDFGASKLVSAIVLQGRQDLLQYVTQYKVQCSNNGNTWYVVKNAFDDEDTVRSLHFCLISWGCY